MNGRRTVFQVLNSKVSKVRDSLLAPYEISKNNSKDWKTQNFGETVILPSLSVVISSVMKQNAIAATNYIPLSNFSVS